MSNTYLAEFVGRVPAIMNHDNIDWREEVARWIAEDKEKGTKKSKAGDDRSPPWKWMGCLFNDGERVVVTSETMMSALLVAGQKTLIVPGKKGNFKDLSQTCLLVPDESVFLADGRPILMKDVFKLRNLPFADQCKGAAKLGFQLYTTTVAMKNGGKITKNIRVRPRFDQWSFKCKIIITDTEAISFADLKRIVECLAKKVGFFDRRPGVFYPKNPGPYGTSNVTLKPIR